MVTETGSGFEIEITAERLARFVWLSFDEADDGLAVFSDNYFDLPAGRSVRVSLPAIKAWDQAFVQAKLRVRSLEDTF